MKGVTSATGRTTAAAALRRELLAVTPSPGEQVGWPWPWPHEIDGAGVGVGPGVGEHCWPKNGLHDGDGVGVVPHGRPN